MQIAQIKGCSNCQSLKEALDQIDCTLLDLIKRKWSNLVYNTSKYFNQELFNDLSRYRRVVNERIYNPSYPCPFISTQDIIKQVQIRVYRSGCSQCVDCFPPLSTTTTTTIPD